MSSPRSRRDGAALGRSAPDLTHLIPPLGADRQGPYRLPKGVITATDYETAVRAGGFGGGLTVGGDLSSVRLPARR